MTNIAKRFLTITLMVMLSISLVACSNNSVESNDSNLSQNTNSAVSAIVGTWKLSESTVAIMSDTIEFRNDGTGTLSLQSYREDFTWSIADNGDLVVVQGGGLFSLAYKILELNSTTLSYETDFPGLGYIKVTYKK
jgi:hypothetical protein